MEPVKEIVLKKNEKIKINLNPGSCSTCAVAAVCDHKRPESEHCYLIAEASKEFFEEAVQSPFIKLQDRIGLRMMASIYSSILLTELYFKKYGIIATKTTPDGESHSFYHPLFEQYSKLIYKFQSGLAQYGMTAAGRRSLEHHEGAVPGALDKYIDAQFKVKEENAKLTGQDKHSRFLQGPAALKPPSPGDSRSTTASRLRTLYDEAPGGTVELDGGGQGDAPKELLKLCEEGDEFQEIVLILGGRSGKSTIASAIASYETCCTDWSPYVQKGELAWFFVVATREQQAMDIGRNMIFSAIRRSKLLSSLIIEDSKLAKKQNMFAHSKTGVLVLSTGCAITAIPCSSRVGRGYPICGCIMDELAWFARESKNETTDRGIYDSILPRMIQFKGKAKMVLISTPADKAGLLYDKWRNRGGQKSYFIVKLPTWKIRTDFEKTFFEHHKAMSPAGFQREFGAEFTETTSPLLKLSEIEFCLRKDADPLPPDKKHVYAMAIDAAFGDRDRFGIAIAHVEKAHEDDPEYKVVFDYVGCVEEVFGEDIVDTAAAEIEKLYKSYDILDVLSDDHQSDSFGKILDQKGVTLKPEPWTAKKHRSRYGRLRSLIKQGRISFPNREDLVEELCGLQIKYLANSGQYTIGHKVGGHDDMTDAVADVVYALTEDEVMSDAGVIMI